MVIRNLRRHHVFSGFLPLLVALGCGETPKSAPSSQSPQTAGTGGGSGSPGTPTGGAVTQAGSSSSAAAGSDSASGAQGGAAAGGPAAAGGAAGTQTTGGGGGGGAAGAPSGSTAPLQIYWIDVEGGAATLMVAPNGTVVLVDAGWSGTRDPQRIAKVVKDEAHADHIEHLIITHYHTDHVGGVPTLMTTLPVTHVYDHGDSVEQGRDYTNYVTAVGNKRILTKPGDKLTLGELVLTFVTAAGKVIDPPLATAAANPKCPSTVTKQMNGGDENAQSLGFLATFRGFRFLDLGDFTWAVEQQLMCDTNRIGPVDLFQVSHHGLDLSNSPQLVHALAPTVAVMNNGSNKGGSPESFETVKSSPGLKDLWSMHQVTANDATHNADPALTANLNGTDEAHFIKAVIDPSGSYTLTNGRTGMSRTYMVR